MMLKDIDYPGPSFDSSAALAAAMAAAGIDPARSAAVLVVATRDGAARAGHRGAVDFYPASVAGRLWSLARHEVVSAARSAAMLALLERSLDAAARAAQPYNQVDGYLGAGLPAGSRLWSKAGRTSETRHDAALVRLPSGRVFVLVAFTEGRVASENERVLPALAERVVREIDR